MGDDRCGCVAVIFVDHDIDTIGSQDFERCLKSRFRECMGIAAQIQRAGRRLARSVVANRLSNSKNVRFIKALLEG